jgi:uncharacterized protein (DUF488 family)
MALPFFTIGHSTRPLGEFVDLLEEAEATTLVDVRTVPRSRTNPQFNRDTLGGLRKKHGVAPEVNGFWRVQSFHNFADYALTESFRAGLTRLRTLGHERRCAIMCAEAVWWRCHRRIIADYLIVAGERVLHILGPDKIEPAHLTEAAHPQPDGSVTYPADGTESESSRLAAS